ncbi:MAG: hypothetical protein HY817_05555 [Candidatus Abawacabacteria bacterium]|nr:hypothetical protein [Candidatus Abawacabacteria bacterium]
MFSIFKRHSYLWQQKDFIISTVSGSLFLLLSIVLNYRAGTYAFQNISNGVRDLILDHLPVFDMRLIFIEGAIVMVIFTFLVTLYEPKHIPFLLKGIALLYLFRSLAIILTHLGPPLEITNLSLANSLTERFVYGADYFFSGHTALPFLISLTFWQRKYLGYFFLAITILFAISSLLGHLHYSIDVYAALFIAHSTFIIAKTIFKKDYERIRNSEF